MRVFGYPFKAIIHEKFGDGILSAVSFRSTVEKMHEDGADWVVLTLKGKFGGGLGAQRTRWTTLDG